MNSSFIDFYKTYEEEDLLLNKEDNLIKILILLKVERQVPLVEMKKRIIFHLI